MSPRATSFNSLRVWRWPALIATLTSFGLLSALLGEGGIWWVLSWIALTIPLLVILACVVPRA